MSGELPPVPADLAQFLAGCAPLGGWDETWAGIPLRFQAYLTTDLPPAAYTGSVRAFVFRGGLDGEVLAVENGSGYDLVAGGRPDPGETLHDALVREVAEETGWTVTPGQVCGVVHARRTDPTCVSGSDWRRPDPDFADPLFIAQAERFDPAALLPDEHPSRFLPAAYAAALVDPLQRAYLERILAIRRTLSLPAGPTIYSDVNAVLQGFLEGAGAVLGEGLVGMYLYGSLATGDFSPDRSDIDFVAVTEEEVTDAQLAALKAMHDRFLASDSPWANEIDGSYIPRAAMRRYDPAHARHPHIERGVGILRLERFRPDWVIQRDVLHRHGVTVAGPPPHTLIDPVSPTDIYQAVRSLVLNSWAPVPDDPDELHHWGGQVYAVLTMCRMLHTLETGRAGSKQAAGGWARDALGPPWTALIDRALAWKKTNPQESTPQDRAAVADLIRLAVSRWRAAPWP